MLLQSLMTMVKTALISRRTNGLLLIGLCLYTAFDSTFHSNSIFRRVLGDGSSETLTTTKVDGYLRNSSYGEVSRAGGQEKGFVYPDRIYGHIHMAKTAGTSLNGLLAARFERVCGHKGYSYDFYQSNNRSVTSVDSSTLKEQAVDNLGKIHKGYYRGRVHPEIMEEIGFEGTFLLSLLLLLVDKAMVSIGNRKAFLDQIIL